MEKIKEGDKVLFETRVSVILDDCIYLKGIDNSVNPKFVHPIKDFKRNFEAGQTESKNKAWELAREIATDPKRNKEIFGTNDPLKILKENTFSEAYDKVAKWESHTISVNDVVEWRDDTGISISKKANVGVVYRTRENSDYVEILTSNCESIYRNKKELTKTGQTIDVWKFLNSIGGMKNGEKVS